MTLNSFCVKVHFGNVVIHHERPVNLKQAEAIYYSYINQYFRKGAAGTMLGCLGNINEELIQKQERQWINFPNFLSWVFNFKCTSQQGLYLVELMHSSIS